MTDYLTRLAERVHPADQVLRPALPSRFAPTKTGTGAELEASSQETGCPSTDVQQNGGTGPATAPDLRQSAGIFEPPPPLNATTPVTKLKQNERSGQASPAAGAARAPETGEAVIEQERVLEQPHAAVSPVAAQPAPADRALCHPPAERRKDPTSPTDLLRGIEEREQAATREGSLISQPTAHPEARENDVRSLASLLRPSPPLGTIQPRTQIPQQGSLPRQRTVVVEPKLPSRHPHNLNLQAAANEQRSRHGYFSAPPEIRVTIGRIEVRAITPPASSVQKEQSPRAPRLSLDAYLRLRNGGIA